MIETLTSHFDSKEKGIVQLQIQGIPEMLTISCNDVTESESLADLIDGYVRLYTHSDASIWNRIGKFKLINFILDYFFITERPKEMLPTSPQPSSENFSMLSEDYSEIVDEEGDYSTPASNQN